MPLSKEQKAIIAKLLDDIDRVPPLKDAVRVIPPAPLSIEERRLIAETLRWAWLTRKEWKAHRQQLELRHYEATKRLAEHGVPYGQREEWIQRLYGKSKTTLIRYFSRIRAR